MEAKEKAIELQEKFNAYDFNDVDISVELAIICVDEIMKSVTYSKPMDWISQEQTHCYWKEVKKHLQ